MATLEYLKKNYGAHKKFCRRPWQKKAQENWFIDLPDVNGVVREVDVFKSSHTLGYSPIYINDAMTGKLIWVVSVSSSCMNNRTCLIRMQNPDLVCSACYSVNTQEHRDALREHMLWQTQLLNEFEIPMDLMPEFIPEKCPYGIRGESYGDSDSVHHPVNMIRMMKANPAIGFTLFTKNHMWMRQALEREGGKPDNAILVASSYHKNKVDANVIKKYTFYDYVFTVWDSEELCEAAGYHINCGTRTCFTCGHCFEKGHAVFVNELLKKAQFNLEDVYLKNTI